MALAVLLTSSVWGRAFMRSVVFFPVLVSTIGVGITFTVLMEPDVGLDQRSARRSSGSKGRAGSWTRSTR